MKRFNLMLLKKGNTRYSFERQFLSRIDAENEGERLMRNPVLSTIYVAYKVVPCNHRRFYYYE